MNPETATLDELQAEFVRLGNKLSTIDGKRRQILRLIEFKKASAVAQSKVAKLNPEERAVLRAALGESE
jgi:hypothetical protein